MRGRSQLVAYLVVGLLIGAFAGYLTRPESAEVKLGPLKIEVTGDQVARGGGPVTGSQIRHIALVALMGGVVGLGLGWATGRGRG